MEPGLSLSFWSKEKVSGQWGMLYRFRLLVLYCRKQYQDIMGWKDNLKCLTIGYVCGLCDHVEDHCYSLLHLAGHTSLWEGSTWFHVVDTWIAATDAPLWSVGILCFPLLFQLHPKEHETRLSSGGSAWEQSVSMNVQHRIIRWASGPQHLKIFSLYPLHALQISYLTQKWAGRNMNCTFHVFLYQEINFGQTALLHMPENSS